MRHNGVVTDGDEQTAQGYGRLDRGVILEAALRVASRPGVRDIRFRELGAELEADPTAVYRHFRNKGELLAALIERLLVDVADATPAEGDFHEQLTTACAALFDIFIAHPAIGRRLAEDRPIGPNELALAEFALSGMARAGLHGEALATHYAAFSGFVLAYLASACAQSSGPATTSISETPWLPHEVEITPESHPVLTGNIEAIFALDFRATYDAGIRVILDAARAAAAAQAPRRRVLPPAGREPQRATTTDGGDGGN